MDGYSLGRSLDDALRGVFIVVCVTIVAAFLIGIGIGYWFS